MSPSRLALAVLFFAALLVPTSPSYAAYSVLCTGYTSCEGSGYSHAGYSANKGKSYWNMYTGTNCTNYVAYRLVTTNGMPNTRPKPGVGNARDWGTAMASVTNTVPTKGSVAWWGKTGNHVAYVEKVVSSTEVWVSESNWSGAFDWRKITKSGSGWPDGFIHFSDPKLINETKPALVGTPKVDTAIKASGGVWIPTGNTYNYQWLAGGTAIAGATAKTFTPTAAQAAKALSVRVTATRPSYPTVAVTSPALTVLLGTFAGSPVPVARGVAKVDSLLTAAPGPLTPAATQNAYVWLADGVPIPGATGSTFSPGPERVGEQISVKVTSTRPGYTAVQGTSSPSPAVALGDLSSTVRPAITGAATVGSTLTTTGGSWSKPSLNLSYQWAANGAPITGATGKSYQVQPADRGKTIVVQVTARRAGYVTASASSSATAAVVPGTFTARTTPVISGTVRVGSRLSATTGVWSPAGSYTFQWYSSGAAIPGATSATYVLTSKELARQIQVRVTARRDGFTTAASSSARTSAVVAGRIAISKSPRVTGSSRLGGVLKVDPGTHSPTNATLTYQWLRDGKPIAGATRSTRRVNSNDLGHYLTAKVTLRASGYASRTVTTAKAGRSTSTAKMTASATSTSRGKVSMSVKVSASGVKAPDGTVTVRLNGKRVATVKVTNGRAKVSLSKQPAGRRTYVLTLASTKTVSSATYNRTLTVR